MQQCPSPFSDLSPRNATGSLDAYRESAASIGDH